jgi:hypothetical protein
VDIILIPGFWLDASSWDSITPVLERPGHRVRALTCPAWSLVMPIAAASICVITSPGSSKR